jgi:hypothetical protein
MIVILNSKHYLDELSRETLENAHMIFLLFGDRFDIIKNTRGKIMLNIPMSKLQIYLLAAAELEKPQ